jgi:NADH:ubiquinone reductase (H+-translocating)
MIAIWYAVVSFMLILYVVLDGRNFGAGMLHWFVAKTPGERRQVIAALGPLWPWHEVWLVGFGGTLLVTFPRLLASAFAGYYLALFLIVWCLILRGVSLEVVGHIENRLWQSYWDFHFFLSSLLLAILFGAAAGNLERGVPLDAQGNFAMAFFTNFFRTTGNVGLLDWYTVSFAIFVAVLLAAHGAIYLTLKTEGPVHDRSATYSKHLWRALVPLFITVSVESWVVRPDLFRQAIYKPICWLGLVIVIVSAISLISGLKNRREMRAFVGSTGVLVGVLATGAAALFPVMLYSTLATENSLTAYSVVSNRNALVLACIWWPVAFVLAVAYFVFISRQYSGKASVRRDNQGFYELEGETNMKEHQPRIVIVGGGFGGLAAAKALRWAPAGVILIDRTNHHLFQPLLYQVATSVLAPGQIGTPIRGILGKQANTTVLLAEVSAVNKEQRYVIASSADRHDVQIPYDYLILATGVRHSYFGHDEFERFAPGLKSLADAEAIRNRILQAFEQAEAEEDPSRHRDLLTFVLVGAGPTGVEMAAALAVMVRTTLRSQFRRIDPLSVRILLVDMAKRVLGTFAEDISAAAKRRLERLGVEVRLGKAVDKIDEEGIIAGGERIASKTVIWTAGVAPSPAGKWLAVETDRAGRVNVQPDCSVPGHPEVFVVGDTASLQQDGKPLPGVAQVAMQQGRYVGRLIQRRASGLPGPPPFRYFDKGNMAVVGKGFAVLQSGPIRMSGFFAWLAWAAIHLQFLATANLRVTVFVQWVWTYLTGQRGSRLIVNHPAAATASQEQPKKPDDKSNDARPEKAVSANDGNPVTVA